MVEKNFVNNVFFVANHTYFFSFMWKRQRKHGMESGGEDEQPKEIKELYTF